MVASNYFLGLRKFLNRKIMTFSNQVLRSLTQGIYLLVIRTLTVILMRVFQSSNFFTVYEWTDVGIIILYSREQEE